MSNNLFGVAERALTVCENRASMLMDNLVNSATPNYKARDIDFKKALNSVQQQDTVTTTHANHMQAKNTVNGETVLYRVPMQFNSNGNTVDNELERKHYMENALRYEASLTFIQNKVDSLMKAIKGD